MPAAKKQPFLGIKGPSGVQFLLGEHAGCEEVEPKPGV